MSRVAFGLAVAAVSLVLAGAQPVEAGKGMPGFAAERAADGRVVCGPRRCFERPGSAAFRARVRAVRRACYPEIVSLCASDMGQPRRVGVCLLRQVDRLSPGCRVTLGR